MTFICPSQTLILSKGTFMSVHRGTSGTCTPMEKDALQYIIYMRIGMGHTSDTQTHDMIM